MLHYEREFFNEMPPKEKRNFIEDMLKRGARLRKNELKSATREQKRRYINVLIAQVKDLERHEIEAATGKQMKDYINKKRWVSMAEFEYLPEKFQKMYTDVALAKKTGLNAREFDVISLSLKKYYAKKSLETGHDMTPTIFKYLDADDQKKYIEMILASGNKLILDYMQYMKGGVEKFYDKLVKGHPYLWESELRNDIRKILFETAGNKVGRIISALKTDEFFDILDASKVPGTTPMEGGCWIVADALNLAFGYPLYVVVNKKFKHLSHFLVKVGDKYLDARSLKTMQEALEENAQDYLNPDISSSDLRLVEYKPAWDNFNEEIVRDLESSKKIAIYLQQQVQDT